MKHLVCLLLLWPALAGADMYRWTDDKGQVHYTQTPPPGFRADKVAPAPPPGANPGMDAVRKFNADADKANAEASKKGAFEKEKKAEFARICKNAQDRITFLEGRAPVRVSKKNEDGSMSRMTQEDYDKSLQEARTAAAKYCQ